MQLRISTLSPGWLAHIKLCASIFDSLPSLGGQSEAGVWVRVKGMGESCMGRKIRSQCWGQDCEDQGDRVSFFGQDRELW